MSSGIRCGIFALAAFLGALLALFGAGGAQAGVDKEASEEFRQLMDEFKASREPKDWEYRQFVDEFTDETSSIASAPILVGQPFEWAGLNVKCDSPSTGKVWSFVTLGYFNNTGGRSVKARFDNDAPADVGIWELESSGFGIENMGAALGVDISHLPSVLGEEEFVQSLIHGDRLRISTRYYQEGRVVLDFSLKGSESAIGKVIDDCKARGWLLGLVHPDAETPE